LWDDESLRDTDYHEIGLTVQDGIVSLRGHVGTLLNKHRAEEAARSAAGVLGVENHLVVDDELVIDVAQALGRDQRTRLELIYVGAQNGIIILNGQVANKAVRDVAEKLAASIPQVRGVVSHLQAPDAPIDSAEQKVLQPPIGRKIHATDLTLGIVERVIINPRNRRVTAFVAHGKFPDLRYAGKHMSPLDIPQQERWVVVPIWAVHYVTESSVILNVSSLEASRYQDLGSTDLVVPPAGWQPPYPYHGDEVLFVREK
jgi:hypothetical protein